MLIRALVGKSRSESQNDFEIGLKNSYTLKLGLFKTSYSSTNGVFKIGLSTDYSYDFSAGSELDFSKEWLLFDY